MRRLAAWLIRAWIALGPEPKGNAMTASTRDEDTHELIADGAGAEQLWVDFVEHHWMKRCDRCGAQHKAEWTRPDRLLLRFCASHSRQYAKSLHDDGWQRA